ncbi:MAG: TIGR03086 family metal-binding protein [Streptosporangiaceae bacterium]
MIDLVPAARRSGALIATITDEQLRARTPCPQYTLSDLLDHVDGLAQAFTNAATKEVPEGGGPSPSGDGSGLEGGWRTRIPERLLAMAGAWGDPNAWEGATAAGGVELPGEIAGLVALNETMVHGWDIARATGQAYDVDPEQAEQCIRVMGPQPGEERPVGDDVPFGRPVEVPGDASVLDRLVATMGRDPSWTTPSH